MLKYFIIFILGSVGYPIIEIIWRGYSHPSMALAGGLSFLTIFFLSKKLKSVSLVEKALYGAVTITIIELVFGIIVNIILNMNVWDYSAQQFNFLGQICLKYFLIWTILSFVLFPLCEFLDNKLFSAYIK